MMIRSYLDFTPEISPNALIAPNATICGDVTIAENANIWYSCVVRGDLKHITIGEGSNIQDGCILHVSRPNHIANKTGEQGGPCIIGKYVTVGHNTVIHAATIQDYAFIGMQAVIMDMVTVESYAMVAAGSVVTPNKVIKSGQIWAGNPARYLRDLTPEESDFIKISADNYIRLAKEHFVEFGKL